MNMSPITWNLLHNYKAVHIPCKILYTYMHRLRKLVIEMYYVTCTVHDKSHNTGSRTRSIWASCDIIGSVSTDFRVHVAVELPSPDRCRLRGRGFVNSARISRENLQSKWQTKIGAVKLQWLTDRLTHFLSLPTAGPCGSQSQQSHRTRVPLPAVMLACWNCCLAVSKRGGVDGTVSTRAARSDCSTIGWPSLRWGWTGYRRHAASRLNRALVSSHLRLHACQSCQNWDTVRAIWVPCRPNYIYMTLVDKCATLW